MSIPSCGRSTPIFRVRTGHRKSGTSRAVSAPSRFRKTTSFQPPQGDLDVSLFPLNPQVTTTARLCGEQRLTAATKTVQNQVASLAERPDQLTGKSKRKQRRVIKTPLIATYVGDDHISDSGNPFSLPEGLDARVPGGLFAEPVVSEPNVPAEAEPVGLLAARLEIGIWLGTSAEPQDRFPCSPWSLQTSQRRGIGLQPDQLLTLVPAGLPQRQSGPQHII
jgi:hypothetical protein